MIQPANYLSMDCPSCGRARLWAYLDRGLIKVRCDKCNASQWECDEATHEKGGPHEQHASAYEQLDD